MYDYVDYTKFVRPSRLQISNTEMDVLEMKAHNTTFDAKKRHSRECLKRLLARSASSSEFAFWLPFCRELSFAIVVGFGFFFYLFMAFIISFMTWWCFIAFNISNVLTVHEFAQPSFIQRLITRGGLARHVPTNQRTFKKHSLVWISSCYCLVVNPHHVKLLIIVFNVRCVWNDLDLGREV